MLVGVVPLGYQHHTTQSEKINAFVGVLLELEMRVVLFCCVVLITEYHDSHKHSQYSSTSDTDVMR